MHAKEKSRVTRMNKIKLGVMHAKKKNRSIEGNAFSSNESEVIYVFFTP